MPENWDLFPTLTVLQNLLLGRKNLGATGTWTPEELLDVCPQYPMRATSEGGTLSGGEPQMLAICRSVLGD